MEVVPPHVLSIGALVPVQKSSPERRNQKEIVAGEERPKFLTINQTEDAQGLFTRAHHLKRQNSTSCFNTLEEFSEFIAYAKGIQTFVRSLNSRLCDFAYFSVAPTTPQAMYKKFMNHATYKHLLHANHIHQES